MSNRQVILPIKRKHLPQTRYYASVCFAGTKAQILANLDKTFSITSEIGLSAVLSLLPLDLLSGKYCDQFVMGPGWAFYIFFFQMEGKILWPIYLPICTKNPRHRNERAVHDFQEQPQEVKCSDRDSKTEQEFSKTQGWIWPGEINYLLSIESMKALFSKKRNYHNGTKDIVRGQARLISEV